MAKNGNIVRATGQEIDAMRARGEVRSDWTATEALSPEDVERLAEEEDGPLPEGWEATVMLGIPAAKQAVNLRLDRDVLGWFRAQGPGYQTRINAVLRAFMSARQRADGAERGPCV
jgi:uncharacterized protein (DUF4415 family)